MPTKITHTNSSKMPRRRYPIQVLPDSESSSESFSEETLKLMRKMDVTPLEDDEDTSSCDQTRRLSEEEVCEPLYHKTAAKGGRDEFVFYRKELHNQPNGLDHFSQLSDEIILQIFRWLPKPILVKCSSVCKRWRDLSYDESLWKKYDFGKRLVKPETVEIVLKRGVGVLRLAMSEMKSPVFSNHFIENAVTESFLKLQYLDLSVATINENDLARLLSLCSNLRKLSVEHCVLNHDCCRSIAQNRSLTVLNMAMCAGSSSEGLIAIAENCAKLREWNLAWTFLSEDTLNSFFPFLPVSIKRLNLSGMKHTLFDDALIVVVKRCRSLIELDISDCQELTERSFKVMAERCTLLEHLHTSRCYRIPTHCNRLLKNLKNFKVLDIYRTLTDEALASLQDYFMPDIQVNQNLFSTIARPTTGIRRTSVWGIRVRD